MEKIQSWAFSVCCASIAGSVLNMLLPEGSLMKINKTVFCVFFLCVLVSPLSGIKSADFDFIKSRNENDNFSSENLFSEKSEDYIEKEIIAETKSILEEKGIFSGEIFLEINISDDGSIIINEFSITFSGEAGTEGLSEEIHKRTGIKPEIKVSGE